MKIVFIIEMSDRYYTGYTGDGKWGHVTWDARQYDTLKEAETIIEGLLMLNPEYPLSTKVLYSMPPERII